MSYSCGMHLPKKLTTAQLLGWWHFFFVFIVTSRIFTTFPKQPNALFLTSLTHFCCRHVQCWNISSSYMCRCIKHSVLSDQKHKLLHKYWMKWTISMVVFFKGALMMTLTNAGTWSRLTRTMQKYKTANWFLTPSHPRWSYQTQNDSNVTKKLSVKI